MSLRSFAEKIGGLLHRALTFAFPCRFPFSRHGMYSQIEAAAKDLKLSGHALSISHSQPLLKILGADCSAVSEANYPDVTIFSLPFPDATFDVVVSDQVFEHVDGLPSDAMNETFRVLKPGGWVLHTTCFHTPYHGPGDFWRFTAEGLADLARRAGCDQVKAATHGHPLHLIASFLGWRRLLVPVSTKHPLNWFANLNWPSQGAMVWVLARKS
jgi:SAM-dependent methyltransferase